MKTYDHYFIIPGLFHLATSDLSFISDAKYPNLSQFFTASKSLSNNHKNLDEVLCQLLNLPDKTLPLAQHFLQSNNILIATPIHLKADINSTWIQPAQTSIHIKTIMDDMVQFFAEDIALIDECDGHFILQFKSANVVTNLPHYLSVIGKQIDAYQQSIREHLDWFKLMNEMQMFLHGHALNKTESGQQILNSLWFWGGDSSQSLNHEKHIRCDDALMQLALSNECKQNQQNLIIKTDLLKYLKLNSSLELEAFFYQFEQELEGLNYNKVCIDTADGQQLVLNRFSKFKLWQKRPTLLESLTFNDMMSFNEN